MHLCGAVLVLCVVAFGHLFCPPSRLVGAAALGRVVRFHSCIPHCSDSEPTCEGFGEVRNVVQFQDMGFSVSPCWGNSGLMLLPENIYSAMLLADLEQFAVDGLGGGERCGRVRYVLAAFSEAGFLPGSEVGRWGLDWE